MKVKAGACLSEQELDEDMGNLDSISEHRFHYWSAPYSDSVTEKSPVSVGEVLFSRKQKQLTFSSSKGIFFFFALLTTWLHCFLICLLGSLKNSVA